MRRVALAAFLLSAVCIAPRLAADTTVYFPNQDRPQFSIVIPDDWSLDQAESAGEFFSVSGPSGVTVWMRSLDVNDDADDSLEASREWLKDNYSDLRTEVEPTKTNRNGHAGSYVVLTGRDNDDDHRVRIGFEALVISRHRLAEIWCVADLDDDDGFRQAVRIIRALRAH